MAYYGLLLFFVLEYVRPTSFIPALTPLHLNSIVPLALVVTLFFSRRKGPAQPARQELNGRLMLVLLGLIAISIPFANVSAAAYTTFTTVLGYALIYWALAEALTDIDKIKGVFRTLVAVHVAVIVLSPDMLLDPDSRTHSLASGSFLGDGNDFALSANIAVPLCLFLLFEAETAAAKAWCIGALLVLVVSIIASQSRGGTLALGAVVFYYWRKSTKKLRMAAVALLVVGAVFAYAPPAYFSRMDTLTDPKDGSAQGRLQSWGVAWDMALSSPVLGVGAGNFPLLHHQTAHSIYFLSLGELGFPGLAVLLTFIIWNFSANRRLDRDIGAGPGGETSRRLIACLSASLLAFSVGGAFLSAIYYPHPYVLAGLLQAGRRLARTQRVTQPTTAIPGPIIYHPALQPKLRRQRIS